MRFSALVRVCDEYQRVLSFFVSVLMLLFLHQYYDVRSFPADAGGYWSLAHPDFFHDFPVNIRGYFYPMLLYPAQFLNLEFPRIGIYSYRIYTSLIYSAVLTLLVPSVFQAIWSCSTSFLRRLVLPLLICILFPGLIVYSLSDLPAFLLLMSCIGSLMLVAKRGKKDSIAILWVFVSGYLAYGSYNTRTIYMFPVALVPLVAISFKSGSFRFVSKAVGLVVFAVGIAAASIPQTMINFKNKGVYSPLILPPTSETSLFALQLMWGINVQKYSTNIGPSHPPTQYFIDPTGIKLSEREGLNKDSVTVERYIELVKEYPIHFIGAYVRHVINGLDVRDGEVYLKKPSDPKHEIAGFNFVVLFFGVYVLYLDYRRQNPWSKLWLIVILLPAAAITPGAIETRFYLPIHFALYAAIALLMDKDEMKYHFLENWKLVVGVLIITYALFNAIATSTLGNQQEYLHPVYMFAL